jgi:ubiquinone/menaquinone biosynthesis C-methylase UbiE
MNYNPQDSKDRSKKYFEKLSSNYSNTFAGRYTEPMHSSLLQELEGKGFKVLLDVGCGIGTFLSMVLNKFDVKVSGIDISPGMIEKSKELLDDRADLKIGDSEHLPWIDKSFDIVTCNASFHHYPNPELVLKEMRRVLKQSGIVIIADPYISNRLLRFLTNTFLHLSDSGDVKFYSKEEMKELFETCGFTLIKWKIMGNNWKKYFISTARSNP